MRNRGPAAPEKESTFYLNPKFGGIRLRRARTNCAASEQAWLSLREAPCRSNPAEFQLDRRVAFGFSR
jgi:hypothetical protein